MARIANRMDKIEKQKERGGGYTKEGHEGRGSRVGKGIAKVTSFGYRCERKHLPLCKLARQCCFARSCYWSSRSSIAAGRVGPWLRFRHPQRKTSCRCLLNFGGNRIHESVVTGFESCHFNAYDGHYDRNAPSTVCWCFRMVVQSSMWEALEEADVASLRYRLDDTLQTSTNRSHLISSTKKPPGGQSKGWSSLLSTQHSSSSFPTTTT